MARADDGSPVVVGFVGAGFAARLHADAWSRVTRVPVEMRGVTAKGRARAEDLASQYEIAVVYDDIDALLGDPAITIVDVCAPNHLHAPVAIAALEAGKHVVVEKPLTGCFDDPATTAAAAMLPRALEQADAIVAAARRAERYACYAENWVYAPPVAKARALLRVAGGTILRIQGEESHSGTHAEPNKHWVTAGGGSLLGKACHPLGAALSLKADEGRARDGHAIVPVAVTAATASLTRVASFAREPQPFLRTGYEDVEDWGTMLVTFSDGSVAEITGADTTLGGVRNRLTVFGSTAVVEANLNPTTAVRAYAPDGAVFADEYIVEKLETKAGWSYPAPDEDWMQGYPQEAHDFAEAIAHDRPPLSEASLGRDAVAVIYGAYVAATEGRRVDLTPWIGL